jgi:hypothetical protein
MNTHGRRRRRNRRREEGAVLLVVMMVLLMVTATATFAIHSTATEVRAAGYARMSMQTSYLGETAVVGAMDWVDRVGPRLLVDIIAAKTAAGSQIPLAPFEPPLAANQFAHRIYIDELDPQSVVGAEEIAPSIAPDDLFGASGEDGPRSAYAPFALVDIYDVHVYTGVVAGFSSSGGTKMKHLRATYTARGRARLRGVAATDVQQLHESAGDARAVGISGPFAM